jgi:transposase
MKRTRRKFSSKFKAKVAIEAIQERMTLQQIASKYEVHPNQISQWKRQFLEGAETVFEGDSTAKDQQQELQNEQDKLYKKIGRLQVENDFLKKSLGES